MENYKNIENGVIHKAVEVLPYGEVTESDLKKINKFTLEPVKAEDIFVFKTVVGDNEIDDRNYEPFDLQSLKDMAKLYIGKTVIKDHERSAKNQIARIFDTELITENKLTGANEQFTKLITKQYMLKTPKNEDLIAEIKAGIKKEVSTGCRAKAAYCSICGTDNTKTYCPHYRGREYDTKNGKKICYFTLSGVKEAFELSLVAVPAQPRAGTTKNYGAIEDVSKIDTEDSKKEEIQPNINKNKESELNLRMKIADSFLFANKNMEE